MTFKTKLRTGLVLISLVAALIGFCSWPGGGDMSELPSACRNKLPDYFASSVRQCAKASGDIELESVDIREQTENEIRGRAVVDVGGEKLELDFSCRRKSLIGWFPSSASFRRRL